MSIQRRSFLWYSLLFLAGCQSATSTHNTKLPERLRFAVTDVKGLEELRRNYEPFRVALEEVLETEIQFYPVENHLAAASALQLNQVDLVLAGPSEYVVIHSRSNAVPVVALTRPNLRTVIAVRQDSGIKSVSDLQGKTMEIGKLSSTTSHIAPIKILLDAGLDPKSDVKLVRSKDYKIQRLKTGEVDAWSRGFHRYTKALQAEGLSEDDYPLIATSQTLPNDIFVASSHLDSQIVAKISDHILTNQSKLLAALLSVEAFATKFKGATLAEANDADYDMIREVYRAIGQDDFI